MKNNRNLRAFSLIEISIVVLIIGILIVGVTQSSRLVAQAKINSAKTLTQSSPASSIDGLVFWIESSSPQESFSNENIEDGDVITIWNDINPQSSIRSNLTVAGSIVYDSDPGINGIPGIIFDATDDELTASNFASISTGKITVFAVVKLPSTLAAGTIVSKADGTSNTNFELRSTSSGTWTFLSGSAGTTYTSTGTAATANGVYVVSVVFNNTSAAPSSDTTTGVTFFQNGDGYGQIETTADAAASTGNLTIGNTTKTTDAFFGGHIGEVIVFDRVLKKEERQSVEEYLGKKWGVKMVTETY